MSKLFLDQSSEEINLHETDLGKKQFLHETDLGKKQVAVSFLDQSRVDLFLH